MSVLDSHQTDHNKLTVPSDTKKTMNLSINIITLIISSLSLIFLLWLVFGKKPVSTVENTVRDEFSVSRKETNEQAKALREEVMNTINQLNTSQLKLLTEMIDSNNNRLDKLRDTVDEKIKFLQKNNEAKLDQIRKTVDEQLQSTLEKRLGESFKLVSERLEAVQRGLGEMQTLATGVGDLNRLMTNVKARGTWGEYQIGNILEELLTPDQYAKNVKAKPDSNEVVEYAVCLPGKGDLDQVWLPIDSKFPQEDYQRLLDALEQNHAERVKDSQKALIQSITKSAKEISDKYIAPPHTTDFAILFLPTESLYAEVLRQPGIMEKLQQTHRVTIASPSTLSALLNGLRMGFRTLAIEKRSSEIFNILAAVKTEFSKFGDVLSRVKKQLDTASNTIEETGVRTRVMEKKLKDVDALSTKESKQVLGFNDDDVS